MQSVLIDPSVESAETSLRKRVGLIVGSGAFAAIATSLPVSFRSNGESSFVLWLEQWLVLSAVSIPLAVAAVAVLRRARVGLRVLTGESASPLALGLLWWCVIEVALLSLFGTVLRKTTHHHALAGVTFAMFAVMSGSVAALFARRVTALLLRADVNARRIALIVAGACLAVGVLVVGLRTSKAEGLHTTATIADAFAFFVTTVVASSRWSERWKRLPTVGVPLGMVILVVGLVTLRVDSAVGTGLQETAPIFALVSGLF
jgi:hypothetical protein